MTILSLVKIVFCSLKRPWRLKGRVSPLLLIVFVVTGIVGIVGGALSSEDRSSLPANANQASDSRNDSAAQRNTASEPTQNPMSMETFWITPTPFTASASISPTSSSMPSCNQTISDTMLIIDKSDSMNIDNKMNLTKAAAIRFVDAISVNTQSRIGVTTFADASKLTSTLTNNFSFVKIGINSIFTAGFTCIHCGIFTANEDIAVKKRTGIVPNAIILTDGKANKYYSPTGERLSISPKQAALDEAMKGHIEHGIIYHTIGFGEVDFDMLQQVANSTGGKAYFSPDINQLDQFFANIATQICQ